MTVPTVVAPAATNGVRSGSALPTRQRRPGWVALGLALVVGFAAIGAYLYTVAGAKTPVVVVVREVAEGRTIQRADVSTIAVAGGVTAIAGSGIESVVGQRAAVRLLPNMLLQRSMVLTGPALASGEAQVGVVVKSGQVPADGLVPGDVVQVVALPVDTQTRPTQPGLLVQRARVFAAREDPAQVGGTLLTLVVPQDQAITVAAASGAGRIALIKVGAQ